MPIKLINKMKKNINAQTLAPICSKNISASKEIIKITILIIIHLNKLRGDSYSNHFVNIYESHNISYTTL